MNGFTYASQYAQYEDCYFRVGHYMNGNLALEIWNNTDGPITKVTVNPDIKIPSDRIAIKDYSENAGMVRWLISMDIIEPEPTNVIYSDWVQIPVHRFTKTGIKKINS